MKAYYEHAGITIYHGDCLEILPSMPDRYGMVILDPPFNLGKRYGNGTDDNRPENEYWDWFDRVIWRCFQSAGDDATAYLFHSDSGIWTAKPRCEMLGWRYKQTLVWFGPNGFRGFTKTRRAPLWSYSHESILYLEKGDGVSAESRPPWFRTVIPVPRPQSNFRDGRFHVAQKPTELMRRLLGFHSECLVVDPFCGAGGTLIAAKKLGRKAVGIDIEEKNCEISAKRLSQEVLQFS